MLFRHLNPYGRLFFADADAGGGAGAGTGDQNGEAGKKPDEGKPADPLAGLTPEQQSRLNSLLAAARKDGEKSGKTAAESAAEAKRIADAEALERQKQIEAGEFTKVRTDLESKLQSTAAEKEAAALALAAYEAALTPVVDGLKAELPKEAVEDYPTEAAAVDRLNWLTARKALLAKLNVGANGNGAPKHPITPNPTGTGKQPEIKSLINRATI